MNPAPGQHGAFVSSNEMLSTINELTVAVTKNNAQLDAVIGELKEVKRDVSHQRTELDGVKAKLYSMSAIIGIAVTLFTNWVTGKM